MKSQLDVKLTIGAGIVLFVALLVTSEKVEISDLVSIAGKAVSGTAIARYLFVKWVWKWSWLRFLEPVHGTPHLDGEWTGTLESTGNEATPSERKKIEIRVRICQPDIFSVKIIRTSDESSSSSFGESLQKTEDGRYVLSYSYLSEPKATVRDRSPISYGTARLETGISDQASLNGNYWTDQKTTGTIGLIKKKV